MKSMSILINQTFQVTDKALDEFIETAYSDVDEMPDNNDIVDNFIDWVLCNCPAIELDFDGNQSEIDTVIEAVRDYIDKEGQEQRKAEIAVLKSQIEELQDKIRVATEKLEKLEG